MIRVHLEIPGDFLSESKGNDMQDEVISTSITLLQHQHQQQQHFQPRRFDIRSPPSAEHLSTAEALAKSLSRIEDDDNFIYNTIMKPLDLMVRQWHGFAATTKTTREQEKRKNSAMTKATSNDSSQPRSKRSSSGSL